MDWGVSAVAAAVLAAAAVALWMAPAVSVVPHSPADDRGERPERGRAWRLPPARPDAAPLGQRVLVASGAALAVGLALRGLGGGGGGPELVNWAVPAVLALAGVVGLGRLEPSAARERRTRLIFDLPQALELLSACLAAGMPLRQATRAIAASFDGPVSEDLGQLLVLVDLGISDADAWRSLRSHPQWGSAAADLARSVESGTMMVEVLMHHARASRELRRAALEVKAKAVGVRSVLPLMTCFLPAFLLVGVIPTVASAVLNALW